MEPEKLPAVFLGHGSPMNAVEDNEFSRAWAALGKRLPQPRAVLCVSAHWLTEGTAVSAADRPPTIHDFGGFPRKLYELRYPAPGSPELAAEVVEALRPLPIAVDRERGLDHGAWAVLGSVFPAADVPVVQLSVDYGAEPERHYEIGKRLGELRSKGVLVVGSGNIVHNLGLVAWDRMQEDDYAYDWAREIDGTFTRLVRERKDGELLGYRKLGKAAALAVPTPDHFYPLLYVLGASGGDEPVAVFNAKAVAGSLTMTSFVIG